MKNKLILPIVALLSVVTGCNPDILDIKNENSYSDGTYFKEQPQFNEAVIATYATLLQNGMYAREWYFTFDLLGNDAERSQALLGDLAQLSEFTYSPGHPQIDNTWQSLYRMVFRANVVLDKIATWEPTTDKDKGLKKQYIAEAKFLRGFAYFNLVNLWGKVPLKLSLAEANDFYAPRTEVAAIWAAVEKDFTDAAPDLPVKYDAAQLGRATKGAALAMLGKSYLYQKKYAPAEQALTELTKSPYAYSLNPSYFAQFTPANDGSAETIFDVPHRWFGWGTNGANQYYIFGGQEGWGGQTTHTGRAQEYGFNDWNNVYVSDALVKSLTYKDEKGAAYIDPRAKWIVYGDAASGADTDYCNQCASGAIPYPFAREGYRWKKYEPYEEIEKINGPASDINSQVIRYADVLLMLAEAKIYQNKLAEALPLLNQVRKRSGAFEYTAPGSQDGALQTLRRERQIEFAGEQLRYFDLVRWGILQSTLNPEKNAIRDVYPTLRLNPVEPKHSLLPIPQSEKDTNPTVAQTVTSGWN